MQEPTGFESGPDVVCQILQALYGLRESAFLWNETFDASLREIGFIPLIDDPCLYTYKMGNNTHVLIYVDDDIVAAPTKEDIEKFKQEIARRFQIKAMGEPHHFLGYNVSRDYGDGTITLSQQSYAQTILARRGMTACNTAETPMAEKWKPADTDKLGIMQEYLEILGELNWLAIKTRPDIADSIGRRIRHLTNYKLQSVHPRYDK